MPILNLLNRVRNKCNPHPFLAEKPGFKTCYLTGLAMQAHCDGALVDEEREHFLEMAKIFNVNERVAMGIMERSKHPNEEMIENIQVALRDTKFKYYFILDLQIMAHQDQRVRPEETQVLQRFAELLDVDDEAQAFLVDLANAVALKDPEAKQAWVNDFFRKDSFDDATEPEDFEHYTQGD